MSLKKKLKVLLKKSFALKNKRNVKNVKKNIEKMAAPVMYVAATALVIAIIAFIISILAEVTASKTFTVESENGLGGTVTSNNIILETSVNGILKGVPPKIIEATNQDITASLLTGFETKNGDINATDSILSSIEKLSGFALTGSFVEEANGFGAAIGPALTLTITPTGLLKGSGTAIESAEAKDVTGQLITGYVSGSGTVSTSDTILTAINKLNGNTALGVSVLASNGFGATNGTSLTMSITSSGLLKSNGTAVSAASNTDITGQTLTGYSSGAGTISSSDTILTAINKLNGNTVQPILQESSVTPIDSVTLLVLDPNVDVIIIDTSNSSALCTLAPPNFAHILSIRLKFQRGLSATIRFSSGGSFVIDATIMQVQIFYSSTGWQILNSSSSIDSFLPNAVNAQKIIPVDAVGNAQFGFSVIFSNDGTTLAIGGPIDSTNFGAVWIYTLIANVWTAQTKINNVSSPIGVTIRLRPIGLSADGNTLAIGGPNDNTNRGAVWIYTRSAGVWTQQDIKLVPAGLAGPTSFGRSGALSADGNILLAAAPSADSSIGALWIFTRSAGLWTETQKITGSEGNDNFGQSCTMSADGSLITGTYLANAISQNIILSFTNVSGTYVEMNSQMSPTGTLFGAIFNASLSANGRTFSFGNTQSQTQSSTLVYTLTNDVWTQQSQSLVGTGSVGNASQGTSTCLSADGNTLAIGGNTDNSNIGATWLFRRTENNWTQFGSKIVGGTASEQGFCVALNSDGHALATGAIGDGGGVGAVWVYW